jgi:hypothetical protein
LEARESVVLGRSGQDDGGQAARQSFDDGRESLGRPVLGRRAAAGMDNDVMRSCGAREYWLDAGRDIGASALR